MSDANELLLAELIRDEGVVPNAYQDSLGYWTIGVGRLIDKRRGGRLSPDEIEHLLINDVTRTVAELDRRAPWWRELDPVRRRVIINMAFNLGVTGLLGFRNTLAKVRAGDWEGASRGMLASKWARQVKGRADRLARMMREG
jgi:lysozyme